MSKNADPLTNKRRKAQKRKNATQDSDLKQVSELTEPSQLPNLGQTTIHIGSHTSEICNRVKKEVCYPTTGFEESTMLFPAKGSIENSLTPPKTSDEEETQVFRTPKKIKMEDSPKTISPTIDEDIMVIEIPKPQVEVINLADASGSAVPTLCSLVRTNLANKLADTSTTTLQSNTDVRVKRELIEKTCKINAGAADMVCPVIQVKNEDSREVSGQIRITNIFSVCIPKTATDTITSVNHLFIDVPVEKQNEDYAVSGNPTTVSNSYLDVNGSGVKHADRPQNNTKEDCRKCIPVPGPPSICCSQIPSEILLGTDNKQQTKKSVENCSIKSEAQENVVCDENKKSTNASVNYLLTTTQERIKREMTDLQENSSNHEKPKNYPDISQKSSNSNNESTETLITDECHQRSISPVPDGGDSQLRAPVEFGTPLLKFFNAIDVLEITNAIHELSILLKDRAEVHVNDFEEIPDTQDKLKLCLHEQFGRVPNVEVKEEKPSIASSSQLERCLNERKVQKSRQNDSPNMLLESPPKMSESSQITVSNSHATYNSPLDDENPSEDNCLSTISLSSLDDSQRREASNNLQMESKKVFNEVFTKDYLTQILNNAKSTEKSNIIADNISSLRPVDPVMNSNIMIGNKSVQNMDFTSKDSKSLSLGTGKRTQDVLFNPPAKYGDTFRTHPKKIKISEEASNIKTLSGVEYKEVDRRLGHYPSDCHVTKPSDLPTTQLF